MLHPSNQTMLGCDAGPASQGASSPLGILLLLRVQRDAACCGTDAEQHVGRQQDEDLRTQPAHLSGSFLRGAPPELHHKMIQVHEIWEPNGCCQVRQWPRVVRLFECSRHVAHALQGGRPPKARLCGVEASNSRVWSCYSQLSLQQAYSSVPYLWEALPHVQSLSTRDNATSNQHIQQSRMTVAWQPCWLCSGPEASNIKIQRAHQAGPVLRLARRLPTLAALVALREVDRPADAEGDQDPNEADSSQPLQRVQVAEGAVKLHDQWGLEDGLMTHASLQRHLVSLLGNGGGGSLSQLMLKASVSADMVFALTGRCSRVCMLSEVSALQTRQHAAT